ncbi:hypothetical protein [Prolixibacter sp. SD074]|jgi:hypothetical protein|uniref:hypothetical protein n=1 Tax=Prolixibacter sp. SD074 TaxID=2652391 RepID=UPI001287FEDA|nr:hypothetical protein [Prolixibacter sp. SD074]GET29041.1 hypothetical protein SD074_12430 [Prolixibacter sp. SD074]
MDGPDYVEDGDKGTIGLGYWLMNVAHFSKGREMTPLYNKISFTVLAMAQKARTRRFLKAG